jgi:hypothetical protein
MLFFMLRKSLSRVLPPKIVEIKARAFQVSCFFCFRTGRFCHLARGCARELVRGSAPQFCKFLVLHEVEIYIFFRQATTIVEFQSMMRRPAAKSVSWKFSLFSQVKCSRLF